LDLTFIIWLPITIFAIAVLYSSVGHGGASGYLAVMALFSVPHLAMRPAALALNILVASVAAWHFILAGYFSSRIFFPFAIASVPAAFIGGLIILSAGVYGALVGGVLLFAAWQLFRTSSVKTVSSMRDFPVPVMVLLGAGIGLLSGLTGVGGGIFLSPLLLLFGLCDARTTSGVTALFVLVNSIAGLAGTLVTVQNLPPVFWIWLAAAGLGGFAGSRFGRKASPAIIHTLLAVVLVIAGLKMMFG
jgi:uncharacterized protein